MGNPNILIVDVETAPILGWVWSLWENTLGLNQIKADWHLLSWSAKWYTDAAGKTWGPHNKVMYQDQRNIKDIEDDSKLLKGIWKLLNEADICLSQNGVAFDFKKLNTRFILSGMNPPSPHKDIDTLKIAKKHFAFTSNKLEFLTSKLCQKFKKDHHKKYPGFELWKGCMAGDLNAWKSMEKYNKHDIFSLEELYHKLAPWDSSVDFSLYHGSEKLRCNCGSRKLERRGFSYTPAGKYQRYQCQSCFKWTRSKLNLLSKDERASFHKAA